MKADESTIDRTLDALGTDEKQIGFQDFLDYLMLFFANRRSLRAKITSVLSGHKLNHLSRGNLTEKEANSFFKFLACFYGIEKTINNIKTEIRFSNLQSYDEFADKVFPIFEKKLFLEYDEIH